MRVFWLVMLTSIYAPSASACLCLGPPSEYFLNAVEQRNAHPYVYVPENAKGILFLRARGPEPERYINEGTILVEKIPLALSADQFSIVEMESGRTVPAVVTRLNVDRQMAYEHEPRFFLGPLKASGPEGLREITGDIRNAFGLFRVGPAGRFRADRRYLITYKRTKPSLLSSDQIEVRIGPAVALSPRDTYTLRLKGQPHHTLLPLPGAAACSSRQAAVVQELIYTVPDTLKPYRNRILFFTQQKVGSRTDGTIPSFRTTSYDSGKCMSTQPGLGELGPLKDLAVATCGHDSLKEDRHVKGYVGMLEVEDTLHETATYRIPFHTSSKVFCAILGAFDRP